MESATNKQFCRRIMEFFKPTGNGFAKMMLQDKEVKLVARTGCAVIEFLVRDPSAESSIILNEFFVDLKNQLSLLISSTSTHDCLLSPSKVGSSACQYYFIFIGMLSRTVNGRKRLDNHGILQM